MSTIFPYKVKFWGVLPAGGKNIMAIWWVSQLWHSATPPLTNSGCTPSILLENPDPRQLFCTFGELASHHYTDHKKNRSRKGSHWMFIASLPLQFILVLNDLVINFTDTNWWWVYDTWVESFLNLLGYICWSNQHSSQFWWSCSKRTTNQ